MARALYPGTMAGPGATRADPMALMQREMALREGAVPESLDGLPVALGHNRIGQDAFLLREPEVAFLYRRGEGVIVARGPGWSAQVEELFLNGSVFAAVASLNGLLPLHASAVAIDGLVVAFTAPTGGGKSTQVAGLTGLGLPLFCDDTLVVQVEADGALLCLPGHKRMKLWPDAVALTGSTALEQVSEDYAKFYVTPGGSAIAEPLPLGALVFLEDGPEPDLAVIGGGEKIARLSDDHYTREMFREANAMDPAAQFALQARIARALPMYRFARPMDPARFAETTRFLADAVCAMMRG